MPIRELFHVVSIVSDIDSAGEICEKLFSPLSVMPKSWSNFDKRWASIGMIGPNFPLELMEPSTDPVDATAPLVKFRSRFGDQLHSLSWFVDTQGARVLVDDLQANGIRVVGPDGQPVGAEVPMVIFTHGRDTLGQLEFMAVGPEGPALRYPQYTGDWGDRSPTWWSEHHPLGLVGLSHITVASQNLDRGIQVFAGALGGELLHRDDLRAFVRVGDDTVVEVATTDDPQSDLAQHLARFGELPYRCTLRVRHLDAAERHALSVGVGVLERTHDTITLDPATTFGTRFAFTSATVPWQ